MATINYAEAAIPEPFQILGLRLKPFCLGHYLVLRRFNCAFVQDEEGHATNEDLFLGVLVCSMMPQTFLRFIEQPDFLKQIRTWGKKQSAVDFKAKAELFNAYLRQGLNEPDYVAMHPQNSGDGDWAQSLKITLVTRLGYTEDEALNLPLSKAFADYYKLAETEGQITLLDPQDREAALANSAAFDKLEVTPWPASN